MFSSWIVLLLLSIFLGWFFLKKNMWDICFCFKTIDQFKKIIRTRYMLCHMSIFCEEFGFILIRIQLAMAYKFFLVNVMPFYQICRDYGTSIFSRSLAVCVAYDSGAFLFMNMLSTIFMNSNTMNLLILFASWFQLLFQFFLMFFKSLLALT